MNRSYRDYCHRHGAELLHRKPPDFPAPVPREDFRPCAIGRDGRGEIGIMPDGMAYPY